MWEQNKLDIELILGDASNNFVPVRFFRSEKADDKSSLQSEQAKVCFEMSTPVEIIFEVFEQVLMAAN